MACTGKTATIVNDELVVSHGALTVEAFPQVVAICKVAELSCAIGHRLRRFCARAAGDGLRMLLNSAAAVPSIASSGDLEILDLSCNALRSDDVALLFRHLRGNLSLQVLRLDENDLDDDIAFFLQYILPTMRIRKLDLSDNPFLTGAAIKRLQVPNTLEELNLQRCPQISPGVLKALNARLTNPKLEILHETIAEMTNGSPKRVLSSPKRRANALDAAIRKCFRSPKRRSKVADDRPKPHVVASAPATPESLRSRKKRRRRVRRRRYAFEIRASRDTEGMVHSRPPSPSRDRSGRMIARRSLFRFQQPAETKVAAWKRSRELENVRTRWSSQVDEYWMKCQAKEMRAYVSTFLADDDRECGGIDEHNDDEWTWTTVTDSEDCSSSSASDCDEIDKSARTATPEERKAFALRHLANSPQFPRSSLPTRSAESLVPPDVWKTNPSCVPGSVFDADRDRQQQSVVIPRPQSPHHSAGSSSPKEMCSPRRECIELPRPPEKPPNSAIRNRARRRNQMGRMLRPAAVETALEKLALTPLSDGEL